MTNYLIKGFVFVGLLLTASPGRYGQQAPQYSLYMLNRYQFNPAYAGMDRSLSINGMYRAQWVDLPGNPVQQNLNAHLPMYLIDGAVGISINHETIGAESALRASLSYNYVLSTPVGLFSAGIAAGFLQKGLDGAALRAPDGDYEGAIIIHNDAELPNAMVRGYAPEFSLGVYYMGDNFEGGIAMTDFMAGSVQMTGATFKGKPAYNLFGEYNITGIGEFDLYPSFLVRTDFSRTQFEAGIRTVYDNFLMLGTGVRGYNGTTIDAITVLMGLRISDHVNLAYGYDITLSALNQVSSGSHEIVMKYNLNKVIGAGLPPPVIYSPRFY